MPARLAAVLAAIIACLSALPTASAAPLGAAHTTARTTAASSQDVPCIDQTPAPGADFQPLHVCASFDKTSYRSSDRVTVTVTITNEGTATATGIWMLGFSSKSLYLPNEWTGLADVEVGYRPGASLPAGATATITTWGWSADPASGSVEFTGAPVQQDSAGNEGPSSANLDITAPVTPVIGNYGGLVYTTTDINDVPAPEAGLPGVAVTMTSIPSGTTYQATTDSQGRFLFTNLPGGPYGIDFTAPHDWIVRPHDVGEVVVTDSGVEYDPNYHAVRPESSILQAAMSFDASSYPVGATATLTVKLTNLTAKPMAGVRDGCNLSGEGGDLNGTGPGWSPLDDPAGATLPPGTTTFHVSETVPQVPVYPGYPPTLYAGCAFGNDVDFQGEPYVSTTALVTGESTTTAAEPRVTATAGT